jgi:hypothetical protein
MTRASAASADHPLRQVRLRRGLTQVELAGLAGLSYSYISMIECGRGKLRRVRTDTFGGWPPMRYRDMDHVDLGGARRLVSDWLDTHTDGTLEQMASDLKSNYPDHPEDMAIVMRGMMSAELRRRTSPPSEIPPDPSGAGELR